HHGMFREHCVSCHGINGNGAGPTASVQFPYPRNFRMGIFKWKSTRRASMPTIDDIAGTLRRGIAGTAMPTFALQAPEDRQALAQYVVFLSIRGQTERQCMQLLADEPADSVEEIKSLVQETAAEITQRWLDAENEVVDVPAVPDYVTDDADTLSADLVKRHRESVTAGRKLFNGKVTGCAGCHGVDAAGGVETLDYDDWTKDYTTRLGITPGDRDTMRPIRAAGALRPQPIRPRDLRHGILHGDPSPQAMYRRLVTGIPGTPMPAAALVQADAGQPGITPQQLWDLVNYVYTLGDG
ncbi:MAG: cytochrome c, partial [Planctomycetota bacterium]